MRLCLPIGYDNFRAIIEKRFHFVDKSLLIADILDDGAQVIVITRPRRFGKTLNLSMLHHFLASEAYGESTEGLFDGLKITQAGGDYLSHQGRYPVIALTLKGVKDHRFEVAYASLQKILAQLYSEHEFLLTSSNISEVQKKVFQSVLEENASEATIQSSLADLSRYLYEHTGVKPWILIDEYDTPIQSAYVHNYYEPMISLMRNFFGAALKTNPYLDRAVITGILRISKESIFSDLNNLQVYSVLRAQYGAYFGFTESEVTDLLARFQMPTQIAAVREWYNGYQIGETVLYNPWSIVNFISEGKLGPYWVNTSDNQLIRDMLIRSSGDFKTQFEQLLQGKSIEQMVDENMVFADLRTNETAAWSLLLLAGYLKVIAQRHEGSRSWYTLEVPNREVGNLYQRIIEQWLANGRGIAWYVTFINDLLAGNIEAFERGLTSMMESVVSSHDLSHDPEAFYHGLMIGLTASLYQHKNYILHSNRESGYGRYDYLIISRDPQKPSLLLEFKRVDKGKEDLNPAQFDAQLEQAAQEALQQITRQKYAAELQQHEGAQLLKIGIAFSGKHFKICSEP